MGYYVTLEESDIFIDKKHFDAIYQKMCDLNDFHELKRGGSYGGNNDKVEGDRYPRDKWFSWMDYNYPETCSNMFEILQALGFEWTLDKDGNLVNLAYYDKTGNEEYFLQCFAGYTRDGDYLSFKGEENDDYFRFVFHSGAMSRWHGEVEIDWIPSEVYEFGKLTEADARTKIMIEEFRKNNEKESLESSN